MCTKVGKTFNSVTCLCDRYMTTFFDIADGLQSRQSRKVNWKDLLADETVHCYYRDQT